jgi:hypothetical protein
MVAEPCVKLASIASNRKNRSAHGKLININEITTGLKAKASRVLPNIRPQFFKQKYHTSYATS